MVTKTKRYTVEEFEAFIELPENDDKILEFISGEIYEVPSNPYVSVVAGLILTFINIYLMENRIGYVSGADGGYKIGGERFAPDVAFTSFAKQEQPDKKGYNTNPPDLAVEVISNPSSKTELTQLRRKITSYLAGGVIVWIIDPDAKTLEVHQPGEKPQVHDENSTVEGGAVLPGFKMAIKDIFPKPPKKQTSSEDA